MTAYYNEVDPFAAQWLRNLIAAGHIAPGEVDERSIVEVQADELRGFDQAHFFAGIGVWSYALRCAGWPDERPVWTGSCPCQPFSFAGALKGTADERHLWPAWFRLICKSIPVAVFGEQVSTHHGAAWLDDVATDLEGIGYAVGAISAGACAVGAPHERQRIYFVAHHDERGRAFERTSRVHARGQPGNDPARRSAPRVLVHPDVEGRPHGAAQPEAARTLRPGAVEASAARGFWAGAEWILCSDGKARAIEPGTQPLVDGAASRVGRLRAYGNALVAPLAQEFIRAYLETLTGSTWNPNT